MKPNFCWIFVIMVAMACLPLAACTQGQTAEAEAIKPVTIERLKNASEPTRETLTQEAAKRLDIQTAQAMIKTVGGAQRTVISYGAILYDNEGNTWAYISPSPLTFLRHQVKVDRIVGNEAILADSLPAGTKVVTTGAEELFGAEFEFAEE